MANRTRNDIRTINESEAPDKDEYNSRLTFVIFMGFKTKCRQQSLLVNTGSLISFLERQFS